MSRTLTPWRTLLLGASTILAAFAAMATTAAAEPQERPTALKPVDAIAPDIPFGEHFAERFTEYEVQVEARLLDLANLARAEAGAGPLTLDSGLSQAARVHAQAMLEARQLSHRFEGELSVPQRLAARTHLQLDQEAENVAFDFSADGGHEHLMLSPPHRANLLNPAYNVVGLGVVRSGNRLYIVQDFGHALPNYSLAEVQERIATAVNQMRRQANRTDLLHLEIPDADDDACSMARSDKLGTSAVYHLAERYTVLTFTTLHPDLLPADATRAITSPNLRGVSIGVCYARTDTYPTGIYWVVLSLD
jgi:uncharacterized protein YkwD